MVFLRLLGGASLESDEGTLSGPATHRHRLALLALLAASHPRAISRDKAIGWLWPERSTGRARNLLKQSVHVLRKALGEDAILSSGDELKLGCTAIGCDLITFDEAVAAGDFERAASTYSGPFLDGFFLSQAVEFERWVDQERERVRLRHAQVLAELAEKRSRRGDYAGAADCWRKLLLEDPCNADATLQLMRALEAGGDPAGALRQARVHALLLEQEFDAAPDTAVTQAAHRLRAAMAGTAVSASSSAPLPAVETVEDAADGTEATAPRDVAVRAAVTRVARLPTRLAVAAAALFTIGLAAAIWAFAAGERQAPEIRKLAVLPLVNLMGDPQQEYFVAGMHDALVSELAKIDALTVYSRQSVLRYQGSDRPLREIARELGVDALVEGAVFRSGDSVRITVQLVRAEPEHHLHAATHHGPLDKALSLQSEVARSIADAVRVRIAPEVHAQLDRQRPVDAAAQEAYVTGLYHFERAISGEFLQRPERLSQLTRAVAHLEAAVALDSTWTSAFARLARAYHWLASGGFGRDYEAEYYPKSKAAALRALALDETESQAHASLGFVLLAHDRDWEGAERAIRRAIELDPNSHHWIYALHLQAAGRLEEAIEHFRRAEERNPLAVGLKWQSISAYACAGRHDEAIAQAKQLQARASRTGWAGAVGDSAWLLAFTSEQLSMLGAHAEAVATAEALLASTDTLHGGATLALAYARAGRKAEARGLADRVDTHARAAGGRGAPALLYAELGDLERALDMVEAAAEKDGNYLLFFRCSPLYELLRDHARMQTLVRPYRFPAPSERRDARG